MKWRFENPDWLDILKQAKLEALSCLTEEERLDLSGWPNKQEQLVRSLDQLQQRETRKILNMSTPERDAMHSKHMAKIDVNMLERDIDPHEYSAYTRLADALPKVDMLDHVEEIQHLSSRPYRFCDKNLEQSLLALKEKQRQVLGWSIMDDIKTKDIAEQTGTSERNVRQLRQRGIDNLRKKYAALLWESPFRDITHGQYEFLQWFDDGMPEGNTPEPVKRKKKTKPETLSERYHRLCSPCSAWTPMLIYTADAGKDATQWMQK